MNETSSIIDDDQQKFLNDVFDNSGKNTKKTIIPATEILLIVNNKSYTGKVSSVQEKNVCLEDVTINISEEDDKYMSNVPIIVGEGGKKKNKKKQKKTKKNKNKTSLIATIKIKNIVHNDPYFFRLFS